MSLRPWILPGKVSGEPHRQSEEVRHRCKSWPLVSYLKDAAAAYFQSTDDGRHLDRCLAVSPTWEENRHLSHEIRSGLKERDLLPKEDTPCTVHESLRWTVQQRGNWRNYQPGQVITVTKLMGGWKAGESAAVARVETGRIVVVSGNHERTLPLKSAGSFDVAMPRPIGVCPGDKILIRANARLLGLINGQVLTVGKIEPDGSLHTREGIAVPATFKQWTHGYVVTSHKAQGRTSERVVVAAARLDAKSSYVGCSRGRVMCSVHTPDKAVLMARLPEGNRKAALDVLVTNPPKNLTADLRSTAYREIATQIRRIRAAVNRRTEQMRQMVRRHDQHRQRASITESVSGPRHTPAESERPHYDFSPVQS